MSISKELRFIIKSFFSHSYPLRNYFRKLSSSYWKLNHIKELIWFKITSIIYIWKNKLWFTLQTTHILKEIIFNSFGQLFFAIFTVWILINLDQIFIEYADTITRYIPGNFMFTLKLDTNLYHTMLSVFAQLAGVFLGLYFASIGLLVSTVYAKASANVRNLFIAEKTGSFYIKIIIQLCAVSTLLMALQSATLIVGMTSLIYISFLAMLSILSFVKIANRTSNLYNPAAFLGHIVSDLMLYLKAISPGSIFWKNASLQNHYKELAESTIETFHSIFRIMNDKDFNESQHESLKYLSTTAIQLFNHYILIKNGIPKDSYWFRRNNEYPDWFTVSDISLGQSIRTSTPLQANQVIDYLWFETELNKIFKMCFKLMIKNNDLIGTRSLGLNIQQVSLNLGQKLAYEEAMLLINTLKDLAKSYFETVITTDYLFDDTQREMGVIIADMSYFAWINFLIGSSERFKLINVDTFTSLVSNINWGRQDVINSIDLPETVLFDLQSINDLVRFEIQIEGKIISPYWYINGLAAAAFIKYIDKMVQELLKWLEKSVQIIPTLVEKKHYIFAAQIIERGVELCTKTKEKLNIIKSVHENLNQLRKSSNIPWTPIDWDELTARVNRVEEYFYKSLSTLIDKLIDIPQKKKFPDYLGFSYIFLSERAYFVLQLNQPVLFKEISTNLFFVIFKIRDRLLKQLNHLNEKDKVQISIGPFLDMIEISGYAIIYSELYSENFWTDLELLWDNLIDKAPNPEEVCKAIKAYIDSGNNPTLDMRHFEWQRVFSAKVKELGFIQSRYGHMNDASNNLHSSAIIRAMVSGGEICYTGQDIFIALYLMKKCTFEEGTIPHRVESFLYSYGRQLAKGDVDG